MSDRIKRYFSLNYFMIGFTVTLLVLLPFAVNSAYPSSIDFSLIDMQGNSESQTVSLDGYIDQPTEHGVQEFTFGLMYGEEDYKRSSEYWYGTMKDSHDLENSDYWYNLSGFEVDEFAGYDVRLRGGLGIGTKMEHGSHVLKIESGPGLIYEERVDGTKEGYLVGRAYQEYRWKGNSRLSVKEDCEYLYDYADDDNYRINAGLSIIGKIDEDMSVKFGPDIRYMNKPVGERKELDIITKATVVWSF